MRKVLQEWYVCPRDNKLGQLHGLKEVLLENGSMNRRFEMPCFDLIPDHRGKADRAKRYHSFRDLSELKLFPKESMIYESHQNMWMDIGFETRESDGRLSYRMLQRGDSYIGNFMLLLSGQMGAGATQNVTGYGFKDVANVAITATTGNTAAVLACAGTAGSGGNNQATLVGNAGMQVGTGTTANSGQLYQLAQIIANTSLTYGGEGTGITNYISPTTTYAENRNFANITGVPITVNEVAMYFMGEVNGAALIVMGIRDVNAAGLVTINAGANSTGTYTLGVTTS